MAGIFFKQYRYYIVILAGVVAGTLLANLAIDNVTDKIGIFNPDFKNAFANVNLDGTLYLRYIFAMRLKEYIGLWLVLLTPAAIAGIYVFMAVVGVSTGMMVSVSVMNMGVKGMFIYAVSLLPQYIIYAAAVFFIVSYIEKRHITMKKTTVAIIISFLFLITGTLYETYISPVLIGKLLEHISYCI